MTNQNLTTPKKEVKQKPNYKYLRDKHREPVKGIFRFHEVPGGTLSFPFREFKEDQVENFTLVDGHVYTIPLGVAIHLNKNCWYPEYEYFKDESTQNLMRIGKKIRRCSFQSLEFVDIADLTPVGAPEVQTVEKVI